MMHKYTQLLLGLLFLSINAPVIAQQNIGCPQMEVRATNGETVVFSEHEFENGAHDLVMSKFDKSDIQRVTYTGKPQSKRSDTCTYKALAIAQGGDWGWHLAWTFNEKTGVFYSRLDGAAWVSTPPKRIGQDTADALKFELEDEKVRLRGYDIQSSEAPIFTLVSGDEGRNW